MKTLSSDSKPRAQPASSGDEDAVRDLADLVHDADVEVRAAAIEALGSIGGPAALRVLREVEHDEDFEDLEIVEDALDAALLTVNPLERRS